MIDITDREIWDTAQVARILRVDTRTVRRWAKERRLPYFYTPGKQLRFFADEVRNVVYGAHKERYVAFPERRNTDTNDTVIRARTLTQLIVIHELIGHDGMLKVLGATGADITDCDLCAYQSRPVLETIHRIRTKLADNGIVGYRTNGPGTVNTGDRPVSPPPR